MNAPQPIRFSVLMPVFNQEKYVEQAIQSIVSQTFQNWEAIIIDDGSTDRSAELIQTLSCRGGDHFKVLRQKNQGPEVARNYGASVAQGEYLVFLDSDDVFYPRALETLDRVIRHFGSPPLVLGTLVFFRSEEGVVPQDEVPVEVFKYRDFLSRTRPLGSATRAANLTDSIVVKRSIFMEIGGMRASTPQTFHNEDSNLLLKLGNCSPCIVINQPGITAYRKHDSKSSGNVEAIGEGWLRLAQAERAGEYRGKNKWARYALIGGRSLQWAYRYCWRGGKRKLAVRMFFDTAPMIVVALVDKVRRRFLTSEPPIFLAAD
jgi:glycosyltransferase involved in cell wall biosynthesis